MGLEIQYRVPCGHLDHAQHTAHRLLDTHGRDRDTVTLRTGHGGVFIVCADGHQVGRCRRRLRPGRDQRHDRPTVGSMTGVVSPSPGVA